MVEDWKYQLFCFLTKIIPFITDTFTGEDCKIPTNPCNSNPCQNNGSCEVENDGGYTCNCQLGFGGTDCQAKIPICIRSTCRNGGSCSRDENVGGTNLCQCALGFTGKRKEAIDIKQTQSLFRGLVSGLKCAQTSHCLFWQVVAFSTNTFG